MVYNIGQMVNYKGNNHLITKITNTNGSKILTIKNILTQQIFNVDQSQVSHINVNNHNSAKKNSLSFLREDSIQKTDYINNLFDKVDSDNVEGFLNTDIINNTIGTTNESIDFSFSDLYKLTATEGVTNPTLYPTSNIRPRREKEQTLRSINSMSMANSSNENSISISDPDISSMNQTSVKSISSSLSHIPNQQISNFPKVSPPSQNTAISILQKNNLPVISGEEKDTRAVQEERHSEVINLPYNQNSFILDKLQSKAEQYSKESPDINKEKEQKKESQRTKNELNLDFIEKDQSRTLFQGISDNLEKINSNSKIIKSFKKMTTILWLFSSLMSIIFLIGILLKIASPLGFGDFSMKGDNKLNSIGNISLIVLFPITFLLFSIYLSIYISTLLRINIKKTAFFNHVLNKDIEIIESIQQYNNEIQLQVTALNKELQSIKKYFGN